MIILQGLSDNTSEGNALKDEFEKALRAHKVAADEMKSEQREAAAAAYAAWVPFNIVMPKLYVYYQYWRNTFHPKTSLHPCFSRADFPPDRPRSR